MTTKDLLEIVILLIGGGGAVASGSFTAATLRAEARMELVRKEVDDWHKFEQKAKQNINHTLVELGLIKTDIRDIKRVLEMRREQSFPDENKPPTTDFD